MTRRRRARPRLSAPLALLAVVAFLLIVGPRLAILAAVALGLVVLAIAVRAAYRLGQLDQRADRRRRAAGTSAVITSPARPVKPLFPAARPTPPPGPHEALRATLRARADAVSKHIPPPAPAPERRP